jgi:hypothetical protein
LLVVAVDGVLADTLPARLACFLAGAEAAGLSLAGDGEAATMLPDWIAGRSWANAARRLAADRGLEADVVAIDLCAMAAEREWTRRLSLGLPAVDSEAVSRCQAAVSAGWRLMLRADSSRRSAGELFTYLENETQAVRTVSGDDPGVLDELSEKPLIMSQYAGIIAASKRYSTATQPVMRNVETAAVGPALAASMGRFISVGWPSN